MAISVDESFVNQLITNQRSAIRYYWLFGGVIFILGVAVIILGFIYGGGLEGFKILINISGAIVSSLGAFQLKEIIHRKEKIGVFEMIKIHLHKIKEEGRSADQTDLKRIEELLWKLIEKTAGG